MVNSLRRLLSASKHNYPTTLVFELRSRSASRMRCADDVIVQCAPSPAQRTLLTDETLAGKNSRHLLFWFSSQPCCKTKTLKSTLLRTLTSSTNRLNKMRGPTPIRLAYTCRNLSEFCNTNKFFAAGAKWLRREDKVCHNPFSFDLSSKSTSSRTRPGTIPTAACRMFGNRMNTDI